MSGRLSRVSKARAYTCSCMSLGVWSRSATKAIPGTNFSSGVVLSSRMSNRGLARAVDLFFLYLEPAIYLNTATTRPRFLRSSGARRLWRLCILRQQRLAGNGRQRRTGRLRRGLRPAHLAAPASGRERRAGLRGLRRRGRGLDRADRHVRRLDPSASDDGTRQLQDRDRAPLRWV